jgi:hypothetical protein
VTGVVKASLLRGVLGGLIATAVFLGLTVAIGRVSIVGTVLYGVWMTCFFALWPRFRRFRQSRRQSS